VSRELATARQLGDDHEVKRDEQIMVRLTREQLKAWQAAAAADQRTLADWVRIQCDAAIAAKKPRKGGR
jgi:hypothetical protein